MQRAQIHQQCCLKQNLQGTQALSCLHVVHAYSPEARLKLQNFSCSKVNKQKAKRHGVEGETAREKLLWVHVCVWQLQVRRGKSTRLRPRTFIPLGTPSEEKALIPAARQSTVSCQHEYIRFISEHAGPAFSEEGCLLVLLVKTSSHLSENCMEFYPVCKA